MQWFGKMRLGVQNPQPRVWKEGHTGNCQPLSGLVQSPHGVAQENMRLMKSQPACFSLMICGSCLLIYCYCRWISKSNSQLQKCSFISLWNTLLIFNLYIFLRVVLPLNTNMLNILCNQDGLRSTPSLSQSSAVLSTHSQAETAAEKTRPQALVPAPES